MDNEGESGGLGEVWIMRVKVKSWGGMDNDGVSGGLPNPLRGATCNDNSPIGDGVVMSSTTDSNWAVIQ